MAIQEPLLQPTPLISGEIKKKPKKRFSPGVIQRLNLYRPLDVAIARTTVRKLADDLGYSLIDQVRLSTAIFEIADKIVTLAGQGEIAIFWREQNQHKGLQFFCNDHGLHDSQLTAFLQTGGHKADSNFNLLSLSRLVDEFKFSEDARHGNCVTMAIWLE